MHDQSHTCHLQTHTHTDGGRIVVYGDSNCVDNNHRRGSSCAWLIERLLAFTMDRELDPAIFQPTLQLTQAYHDDTAGHAERQADYFLNMDPHTKVLGRHHKPECMQHYGQYPSPPSPPSSMAAVLIPEDQSNSHNIQEDSDNANDVDIMEGGTGTGDDVVNVNVHVDDVADLSRSPAPESVLVAPGSPPALLPANTNQSVTGYDSGVGSEFSSRIDLVFDPPETPYAASDSGPKVVEKDGNQQKNRKNIRDSPYQRQHPSQTSSLLPRGDGSYFHSSTTVDHGNTRIFWVSALAVGCLAFFLHWCKRRGGWTYVFGEKGSSSSVRAYPSSASSAMAAKVRSVTGTTHLGRKRKGFGSDDDVSALQQSFNPNNPLVIEE